MIHFKNKNGFTLIETLLALAIMAMMLLPIYLLQGSAVRNTYRYARQVERIMQAKLFLIDTAITNIKESKNLSFDKKIKDPATDLKFEQKKIGENSVLKKFNNLMMQQVNISWTENRVRKSDALVTFVFRPETQKKEEKQ